MKDGRITEAMARCDKSEHLYRIKAKIYLRLHRRFAARRSKPARRCAPAARRAREFNESLAPEKADDETLGSSILFTSRLYRKPMPFTPPKWARKVTKEQLRPSQDQLSGSTATGGSSGAATSDIIRDNERIRFELLSIVMGVWDYIKNSGDFPDSANWAMDWVGMMPGKRGSRRLVGDHMLTQHDLMQRRASTTRWRSAAGRWTITRRAASTAPTCRRTRCSRRRRSTTFRCVRSTAGTSRT